MSQPSEKRDRNLSDKMSQTSEKKTQKRKFT